MAGSPAAAAAVIAPATVPGGSDVYLIPPREGPERIWTGAQDVVYSLALDSQGRLLIASGNKGNLYRVETHSLYLTLETFPVEQVTMLLPAKDGTLYAATGNVGKVFRVGPGLEQRRDHRKRCIRFRRIRRLGPYSAGRRTEWRPDRADGAIGKSRPSAAELERLVAARSTAWTEAGLQCRPRASCSGRRP